MGAGTAAAHTGDPAETDEQHAAQDLAGVSMEKIEKDTREQAADIKEETGVTPGRRAAGQQVPNAAESRAAAADPAQGGQWSPVQNTPVVPIFQAVLPNGKVLLWDSVGDQPAESYPGHTFTRASVWDPKKNTSKQVNVAGYNIFCAGYAQLADGRVLVAGGNKNKGLDGIVQTHIFDWRTESWSRGADMNAGRWYPSVAALGNGEAVIVGGGPGTAEVFQKDEKIRRLTGFTSFAERVYPFLVPRPDGQVELIGPNKKMNTMKVSGTGALTATKTRDGIDRDYGSFATYDIGKVLVAGGGDITEGGKSSVPTKTATVVDVNGTGSTARATSSMSVGRRQHNLTVLADGSVLATGGQSTSDDKLVDLDNPVFAAELWDPETESWSVLASASRVRQYHSAASLLPDGRVLTGGGGVCGSCAKKGYLEKNVEYFTPPYLYRQDGSGTLADRPVIDAAPATATYAQELAISSEQAGSVAKVGLVRLGAATHGDDQGQRYVPLDFRTSGSTVTATGPATANIAPPGYYMLFVTDDAGVPSVAKIIQVTPKPAGSKSSATSDYDGDGTSDPAVWRPSTGAWYVQGMSTTTLGAPSDLPVPADYDGDRKTDIAVWTPATGQWSVRGMANVTLGASTDKPVPADYNGDGSADVAVWKPSTGTWTVRGETPVAWGAAGDIPMPGDYNGDGKADLAVWRPSNGKWYVKGAASVVFGKSGDKPVRADFNGDGKADLAYWRPSSGKWHVRGAASITYGSSSKDKPVQADFNGDGKTDIAYWRASSGNWHIRGASTVAIGREGDRPV